jgi:hypothetical protein
MDSAISIDDLPGIPDDDEARRVHNTTGLYYVSRNGSVGHDALDCTEVGGYERIVGNPYWHVATSAQVRALGYGWCTVCCEAW